MAISHKVQDMSTVTITD